MCMRLTLCRVSFMILLKYVKYTDQLDISWQHTIFITLNSLGIFSLFCNIMRPIYILSEILMILLKNCVYGLLGNSVMFNLKVESFFSIVLLLESLFKLSQTWSFETLIIHLVQIDIPSLSYSTLLLQILIFNKGYLIDGRFI